MELTLNDPIDTAYVQEQTTYVSPRIAASNKISPRSVVCKAVKPKELTMICRWFVSYKKIKMRCKLSYS